MSAKNLSVSVATAAQIGLVVLVFSTAFHCDESLPPRGDPQVFLQGTLWVTDQTFVSRATGALMQPANMHVYVRNLHDEVLQDSLQIRGAVEIQDTRRPGLSWQMNLRGSRTGLGGVAPSGGILTLGPQEQVDLPISWAHMLVDQSGRRQFAWVGVASTLHYSPYNEPYLVTDTLYLSARATVKVFKTATSITSNEVIFRVVYWIFPDTIGVR